MEPIEGVTQLSQIEFDELRPKGAKLPQIRASHHRMAELHGAGLSAEIISDLTGRSLTHVRNFPKVPANAQLISEKICEAAAGPAPNPDPIAELTRLKTKAATLAITKLVDRLEDEGYEMSDRMLLAIAADQMDRIGHGKTSTQINLNLDLGQRLQKAREAHAKLRESPTIELAPSEFRRRA